MVLIVPEGSQVQVVPIGGMLRQAELAGIDLN